MKRVKEFLLVLGLMLCLMNTSVAGSPLEIPLWPPGTLPKLADAKPEQIDDRGTNKPDRAVSNVTVPTLTVYLPDGNQTNTIAVAICPGGAYSHLAIDK